MVNYYYCLKSILKFKLNCSKLSFYIFLIIQLPFNSCTNFQNPPKNWSNDNLEHLSIREKIAQMMIYSMNMKFEKVSEKKWNNIFDLIKSDGIGGVHLWYGEASSSVTIMNQMQKESKIPILFDADLETGLKQRFSSGTEFPPAMAIGATGNQLLQLEFHH